MIPDESIVKGESYAAFLGRSTTQVATSIRAFVNGNLRRLPEAVGTPLCKRIRSRNFHEANFELIVARTLQELGADLEYEPLQVTGKRPDFLARFNDGAVFVDATSPRWLDELVLRSQADWRLIEIIEVTIPPGWSYIVKELPTVGMSDSTKPFRRALERAFSSLEPPRPDEQVEVGSPEATVPFRLDLRSREPRGRAWLAGPGNAAFTAPERRIQQALHTKRVQLRGLGHPALVAFGGALGASDDDYDIALYGHRFERQDQHRRVVERGFHRDGEWSADRTGLPTVAGVLAYRGIDVTTGFDPALYLHPRFEGVLPTALLDLEMHTLEADGPRVRPARVRGLMARLQPEAEG